MKKIFRSPAWVLPVWVFPVMLLAGCHHQYRLLDASLTPMKPLPPRSSVPIPLPMIEHTTLPTPDGGSAAFNTAYIEFKDSGCMFDPAGQPTDPKLKYQLEETRKLIQSTKPSQVVLYVHGWNNNASEESADVARFRFALSYLSLRMDQSAPLLGIFIGWRGGTFKGGVLGPFTFTTYWSRKQGAKRVAEGHCQEPGEVPEDGLPKVINNLLTETTKANADRHFYAIGHSFGARVLEGALEKSDYAKGIYDAIRNHPDQPYELPIDLVLLINPATDSMKTEKFLNNLKADGGSHFVVQHPGYADADCPNHPTDRRCRPYPLMVEVSSVGDYLTGIVMPAANVVNYVPPFLFLAQPSAKVLSAPFTPGLRTHTVTSCDGKAKPGEPCGPAGERTAFDFELPASPPLAGGALSWERVEKIPSAKQDLIWIMTVDTKISLDHGDVWNGNVAEMMFALVDPNGPAMNYAAPAPAKAEAAAREAPKRRKPMLMRAR